MRRILQAVTIWTVLFGISNVSIASPIVFRFASDGGTAGNQWIVADEEITAATPDEPANGSFYSRFGSCHLRILSRPLADVELDAGLFLQVADDADCRAGRTC